MTEDLARAAVAAVEADWSAILRIAIETGQGLGLELLQYCAALVEPSAGSRVVAIVRPPAEGECLAAAWHARQMRTIVLFEATDDPVAAMVRAAARAGCGRLLLADLPMVGTSRLTPRAEVDGIDVLRPFLRPQFASVLQASDDPLADLARARARLARQVFDPEDGGGGHDGSG
ncbi:MAG: hypothetical protein E6Q90_14665 [Actinobacteria bacterium]|nr:MAG: hypothetical protein E6Q90_14665 [Actinomycetota bacterium]